MELKTLSTKLSSFFEEWKQKINQLIEKEEEKIKIELIPYDSGQNEPSLSFWPVSCTKNQGIDNLCDLLPRYALTSEVIQTEVLEIIDTILKERETQKVISLDIFDEWIMKTLQIEKKDCELYHQQFQQWGYILKYPFLPNQVIIDPQWLADQFRSLFSFKHEKKLTNGILSHQELEKLLGKDNFKEQIKIFEEFDILIENPKEKNQFIIPYFLPKNNGKLTTLWNEEIKNQQWIGRRYEIVYFPYGMFSRLFIELWKELG